MAQPLADKAYVAGVPVAPPPAMPGKPAVLWGLTRNQVAVFAGLVVLVNLPLLHRALRFQAPVTERVPFVDDFNRAQVGPNYRSLGGQPEIVGGALKIPGVKNNPLWLQVALPAEVRVEFDARSDSPEGDIKAEIFGNGYDHSSGYVLIQGGWGNSISVISRLDEHGLAWDTLKSREKRGLERIRAGTAWRVERREPRVVQGRTYRWRIERA